MKSLFCGAFCLALTYSFAQEVDPKSYYTQQVPDGSDIQLDGILDDLAWEVVEWGNNFTETRPDDGAAPTRQTQFKILFDLDYLYIGFRCFDEDPDNIESRMSRRDGFAGDWVEINIDSYFDRRTAFSFTTSVSGVKGDEFISNNGNNWDTSWDPIWNTKTNIDSLGWTAEVQIPLSQLRFGNKEHHEWGIQITRRDFRSGERSQWQYIPRNASGFVSNFGSLHGIRGIKSQKQLEIQPYVTSSVRTSEVEPGNPFATGKKSHIGVGLDGKIGVTSDLTLDFTVNPDFGQVEADPSALNIDGFQIFFSERRPFFVENNNLFDYRIASAEAGGPFTNDNLFYSRRIGRAPRGYFNTEDNEFTSFPEVTSILGAAKFSGKTKKGTAIGILESVTSEEFARAHLDGQERKLSVEPLSNYFVGRLSQDFREGQTVIGGMITHVSRRLQNSRLSEQFTKSAVTGGLDFKHTWKKQEWQVGGNLIFSLIKGSQTMITDLQQSFEHYFQRPDADHLSVDEQATELSGHGGNLYVANYGGKDRMSFQGGVTWRSPGIDLNDIGFLNEADFIFHYFWAGYNYPKSFLIFNNFRINYNHYLSWTYGGEKTYSAVNSNLHFQFKNQWRLGAGSTVNLLSNSTKALFGGPMLRQPLGTNSWMYIGSDNRKKISVFLNLFKFYPRKIEDHAQDREGMFLEVFWQPSNAISVSAGPNLSTQGRLIQNVALEEFNGEDRYVTASVKQHTLSFPIRANVNLSPTLTIQYWGQPFISKGNYKDYKYITNPRAEYIHDQYQLYHTSQILRTEADDFLIDENMDGQTDYRFGNPNFNFMQFRSNLVLRWEYKTGSELYLVWSQSNTANGNSKDQLIPSLQNNLFSNQPTNIFFNESDLPIYSMIVSG